MNRAVQKDNPAVSRPRAQIDAAALADAFAADGLHGTSSASLAAALGIAKPTLYAHGTSKEALFLRAVEAEVERVLDRLHAAEAATAGRSARDRATAIARALLDHAADRPAGALLLAHTARHGRSAVAFEVAAAVQRIPDRIEIALRRDLAADAAPVARALHGAALALVDVGGSRATLAALAASVVPEAPAEVETWPVA